MLFTSVLFLGNCESFELLSIENEYENVRVILSF